MITRYLLDNDTLSRMSSEQRQSSFVRKFCTAPTAVLDEASGYIEPSVREAIEEPVTVIMLDSLRRVMASLPPGDRTLVDLYGNKGTGDAMLLAVALTKKDAADQELFGDTWIIATGDKGLTAKATELGILTCTDGDFIAMVNNE